MFRLVRRFLGAVLPGVVRPLQVLWNEFIGFLFLCLSVLFLRPLYTGLRDFHGEWQTVVQGVFALLLLSFGVASFLRARRIRRSG